MQSMRAALRHQYSIRGHLPPACACVPSYEQSRLLFGDCSSSTSAPDSSRFYDSSIEKVSLVQRIIRRFHSCSRR